MILAMLRRAGYVCHVTRREIFQVSHNRDLEQAGVVM